MFNQIVVASMVAEGLVCGLWAYVLFRRKSAKVARCQKTLGEVIEVKEHCGGEGTTRHPVIRYKAANGEEVTFESPYGSSGWKVKAGDQVEILVDPANPSGAEVAHFMAQWGMPLIFALVSVSSLVFAPVVYWLLR